MSINVGTIKKVKERAEKILSLFMVDYKINVSAEEGKIRVSIDSSHKTLFI